MDSSSAASGESRLILAAEGVRAQLTRLAEFFVSGVPVDLARALPEAAGVAHVELPTYPFQRRRYWPAVATGGPGRYTIGWTPVPTAPDARLDGWVVLSPGTPAADAVVAALRTRAENLVVLPVEDPATLAERIAAHRPTGVLALIGLDVADEDPANAVTAGLAVLRAGDLGAPLWFATGDVDLPGPAALWGLGRVAAPWNTRVPGVACSAARRVRRHRRGAVVCRADRRGGPGRDPRRQVYARRLHADTDTGTDGWTPRGTVLVTGGTGRSAGTSPVGWPRPAPASLCWWRAAVAPTPRARPTSPPSSGPLAPR